RSVATISRRSPRSYTSRTLPRRHQRRPGIRVSSRGREASMRFNEAAFVMEEELPVPVGFRRGGSLPEARPATQERFFSQGFLAAAVVAACTRTSPCRAWRCTELPPPPIPPCVRPPPVDVG